MGKKLPWYLLKQYLFWMLFFALCRTLFLLYNFHDLREAGWGALQSYRYAFRVDTSMAAYLLVLSWLFYSAAAIFHKKIWIRLHVFYIVLLLLVFSIIAIAELQIYREWGTKINNKALGYLKRPGEIYHSVDTSFFLLGWLGVAVLITLGVLLFRRLHLHRFPGEPRRWIVTIVCFFLTPVLLGIAIRGGFQQIPIEESDAYFSSSNFLNLAAVNSGWTLSHSIIENRKVMGGNPYRYYPLAVAQQTVDTLYRVEKDSTLRLLSTTRPNVVLFVLEGWSGDLVESLGGYKGVMPHFEQMIQEGVFFTHAYASGSRSDQGMAAVFSAFPAQPKTSIITQPGKFARLPSIVGSFAKAGYRTSYMFGGQLSYGNIRAYMYYNHFDRIEEGEDFAADIPRGKLGVHDEYLFARQLKNLHREPQPFFAAMFTMSTHTPYDFPGLADSKLPYHDKYLKAAYYDDEQIRLFLDKASREPWFNNTLFVFVPDHSHTTEAHENPNEPDFRRIPMLFWGPVIKKEYRGTRCEKVCSQIDLAATLLKQLDLDASAFTWSKNLFNPYTREFAYFALEDGYGWVRPGAFLSWSHDLNRFYFEHCRDAEQKNTLDREGKSFLETMFQQYTDY